MKVLSQKKLSKMDRKLLRGMYWLPSDGFDDTDDDGNESDPVIKPPPRRPDKQPDEPFVPVQPKPSNRSSDGSDEPDVRPRPNPNPAHDDYEYYSEESMSLSNAGAMPWKVQATQQKKDMKNYSPTEFAMQSKAPQGNNQATAFPFKP